MRGIFQQFTEIPPISCSPDVPYEQACAGPLLGYGVPQLRHSEHVGLDTEASSVQPVSEFLEHAVSAPI